MKNIQQPVRHQQTSPAPLRQGVVPLELAQLRHVVGGTAQVKLPKGTW